MNPRFWLLLICSDQGGGMAEGSSEASVEVGRLETGRVHSSEIQYDPRATAAKAQEEMGEDVEVLARGTRPIRAEGVAHADGKVARGDGALTGNEEGEEGGEDETTPLFRAVQAGDTAGVEQILARQPELLHVCAPPRGNRTNVPPPAPPAGTRVRRAPDAGAQPTPGATRGGGAIW